MFTSLSGLRNRQWYGPLLVLISWFISQGLHADAFAAPLPGATSHHVWSSEIVNIADAENRPPAATVTASSLTGTSPLSVTFTGSASTDPDGDPLTYAWDFGDGSSSTQADPVHSFVIKAGAQGQGLVVRYTVVLTVTDDKGLRDSKTLQVVLTNKAPVVKITSPVSNTVYPLDRAALYTLTADVNDEVPTTVTTTWQVTLRYNNRNFPEPAITGRGNISPTVSIAPVGCNGDNYYYLISLNVTDAGGLSTQDSLKIYPATCSTPNLNVTGLTMTTLTSGSIQLNWTNPALSFDDVLVVGKAGSSFSDRPTSATYTANASFTGNGATFDGGKVVYQGTSNSVVVSNLTPGQSYYFRVYTRTHNSLTDKAWTGGVEIRTMANRPPLVVATSTSLTGTSPLSVTFTGSGSSDPDGDALTYEWRDASNFSTLSTQANPVLTFTPQTPQANTVVTNFSVQLVVRDTKGAASYSQTFYVSLTTPSSASVVITPKACYRLTARVSGKVLSVEAGSLADGGTVRQRTDAGQTWQQWRFTAVSDGYYQVIANHSSKVLDVTWGQTTDGAPVQQWTYGGAYQQQWLIRRDAEGYYQLVARHSGKVLDVQNSNQIEGGVIDQYTANGSQAQQWRIEQSGCVSSTVVSSTVVTQVDPSACYVVQSRSSGKVLGVTTGQSNDGALIRQYANTNQLWQQWRIQPADPGYYRITVLHTGKSIDVPNASTANQSPLQQWTFWGGSFQQWVVQRNESGFFTFTNRNSGKAIEVKGASNAEGGDIVQATSSTAISQQWTLIQTGCPANSRLAATVSEAVPTIQIWPNPAQDVVMVDLRAANGQPTTLGLTDLTGRSIGQTLVDAPTDTPYHLNTGTLPNGLYLINVAPTGTAATTVRLLIQR